MLAFADPSESTIGMDEEENIYSMSSYKQYLIGIMFTLFAVVAITGFNLTTRFLQGTHHMIIQIPYNGFSAVIFIVILSWQYGAHGVVPFSTLTDSRAFVLLGVSAFTNFLA